MESYDEPVIAIIKPTNNCNLNCKYCYVENDAEKGMMSKETLRRCIEEIAIFNKFRKTTFYWHGGEPLLMGIDFFRDVVSIQKEYFSRENINNKIQTNLTLLDDEYIEFFKSERFFVGTSLDGSKSIHNSTRIYKNKEGTFDDVFKNIQLLKRNGINVGVMIVLNKYCLGKIEEVYSFFKSNKIDFKPVPLIHSGSAYLNKDEIALTPKQYGDLLVNLFDNWFYDRSEPFVDINTFDLMIGNILTKNPQECTYSGTCRNRFISIGPEGDVYPCGRFDGITKFKLGNIQNQNLKDILSSDLHQYMLKRNVNTIEECTLCEFKQICNGGCLHHSYIEYNDIMRKDYFCDGYKIIFRHITQVLQKELERISKLSPDPSQQPVYSLSDN